LSYGCTCTDVRKGDFRASRPGLQPPYSMRPVIGEEAEA